MREFWDRKDRARTRLKKIDSIQSVVKFQCAAVHITSGHVETMMPEPKNMLNREAQASNSLKAADRTIGALDARRLHEADGQKTLP